MLGTQPAFCYQDLDQAGDPVYCPEPTSLVLDPFQDPLLPPAAGYPDQLDPLDLTYQLAEPHGIGFDYTLGKRLNPAPSWFSMEPLN